MLTLKNFLVDSRVQNTTRSAFAMRRQGRLFPLNRHVGSEIGSVRVPTAFERTNPGEGTNEDYKESQRGLNRSIEIFVFLLLKILSLHTSARSKAITALTHPPALLRWELINIALAGGGKGWGVVDLIAERGENRKKLSISFKYELILHSIKH